MTNREWLNSLENIAFWNAIGCSYQICNFFSEYIYCKMARTDLNESFDKKRLNKRGEE